MSYARLMEWEEMLLCLRHRQSYLHKRIHE